MHEPAFSIAGVVLKLILKFILKFIPGTLGALTSLFFSDDELGKKQQFTALVVGSLLAWYGAPLVVGVFHIPWEGARNSIGFFVGLGGIRVMREVFRELPKAGLPGLFGALKHRFLGGE